MISGCRLADATFVVDERDNSGHWRSRNSRFSLAGCPSLARVALGIFSAERLGPPSPTTTATCHEPLRSPLGPPWLRLRAHGLSNTQSDLGLRQSECPPGPAFPRFDWSARR